MALTDSLQLLGMWGSSATGDVWQGEVGASGKGDKDCPAVHPTHGLLAWVVVVQLYSFGGGGQFLCVSHCRMQLCSAVSHSFGTDPACSEICWTSLEPLGLM